MAEGRMGNRARGRQRFRTYVQEEWKPNHQMEARTRENYTYYFDRHILPWFGSMRMIEVMPADVREWITHLQVSQLIRELDNSAQARKPLLARRVRGAAR
jgi:hypothetical protein